MTENVTENQRIKTPSVPLSVSHDQYYVCPCVCMYVCVYFHSILTHNPSSKLFFPLLIKNPQTYGS